MSTKYEFIVRFETDSAELEGGYGAVLQSLAGAVNTAMAAFANVVEAQVSSTTTELDAGELDDDQKH